MCGVNFTSCPLQNFGDVHPSLAGSAFLAIHTSKLIAQFLNQNQRPPPPTECRPAETLGCFNYTGVTDSLLPNYQPQLHDLVTLETCAKACWSMNLTAAGVAKGNRCFCATRVLPARLTPRHGCAPQRSARQFHVTLMPVRRVVGLRACSCTDSNAMLA